MQKAIITGATGAIGLALIRELTASGVEVTALIRPGSARNDAVRAIPKVQTYECDLADLASVSLQGPYDVFYHFAWEGTSGEARNDMKLQTENVRHTLDAADLAHRLGCRRFIGAGSQAEYGRTEETLFPDTPCRPETGYGIAKFCAGVMSGTYCKQLGMEHVWTRILSVYGPGDGAQSLISVLTNTLLAGQSPQCTKGEQLWDYIYAGDAAAFLHRLADAKEAEGKVFCIGSGRAQKLYDYMEQVRKAVGVFTGKEAPQIRYDRPYPPGQVMHLTTDITELKRITGYEPQTDFAEGIRMILESNREHV